MKTQSVGNGGGAGATAAPATTGEATFVTATSAVLTGTVLPSTCPSGRQPIFLYGTTTNYGNTALGAFVAPSNLPTPVMATVTGLEPATTYHVRLTANDSCGTTAQINDVVFVTPARAAEPVVPATSPFPTNPMIRDTLATRIDGNSATAVVRVDVGRCVDQPLSVRVALRDDAGTPVPGATVDLLPSAERSVVSDTDAAMPVSVSVTGLSPGRPYTLRASASNACGAASGTDVPLLPGPAPAASNTAVVAAGATVAAAAALAVVVIVLRRRPHRRKPTPT